ncbi:MAG: flippase-like domain-containing protein [Acetatifactor sp.]|nr:flippase-like domain-containing protein [Acetatifactor sp.]
MRMKNKGYQVINLIVLAVSAGFFVHMLCTKFTFSASPEYLLVMVFATVLVHLLKGLRLYIIMCESDISLSNFVKTYCKVIPVSMILPCKIGELYRMYCYGIEVKNYVEAVVVVLFDRLIDTLGLVMMMLVISLIFETGMTAFLFLLIGGLLVLFVLYYSFPGIYKFWNHHLIEGRATERKLAVLQFLSIINQFYQEIRKVSQGRWSLLFLLSIAAWACEIGAVVFTGRMAADELGGAISRYLQSSMGNQMTDQFAWFLVTSFILLTGLYVVIRLLGRKKGSRKV